MFGLYDNFFNENADMDCDDCESNAADECNMTLDSSDECGDIMGDCCDDSKLFDFDDPVLNMTPTIDIRDTQPDAVKEDTEYADYVINDEELSADVEDYMSGDDAQKLTNAVLDDADDEIIESVLDDEDDDEVEYGSSEDIDDEVDDSEEF